MSQFVIRNYGRTNNQRFLPNMRGIIIKSNNLYYNPNTGKGAVGASCQSGNLGAVRRRV
jgi:hypothetical protein